MGKPFQMELMVDGPSPSRRAGVEIDVGTAEQEVERLGQELPLPVLLGGEKVGEIKSVFREVRNGRVYVIGLGVMH